MMTKSYLMILFVALILQACSGSVEKLVEKEIDPEKPAFQIFADTKIYFKNTRQLDYDIQSLGNGVMEIYRHKKRSTNTEKPCFTVALATNWRNEEAYVAIEPNSFFTHKDTIRLLWQSSDTAQEGVYEFSFGSKPEHFKFASQVFLSIKQQHKLFITNKQQEKTPFLENDNEKQAFRKTMIDYYRLVRIYD
jgi:hypothetical protein